MSRASTADPVNTGTLIDTAAVKPHETALRFLVQWITVSIVGWFRIALRMVRFHLLVVKSVSPLVHAFIIASIAVGALPVFGWFRYSISLGEKETFEVTTNLWYLFFLPGATALLLIVYPFQKAFQIQTALSGLVALLYVVAFFFPEGLHYDFKLDPQPTGFYYAYAAALALHLTLCAVLKKRENGILYKIREQWKIKAA
jgi:hypothetical protein